METVEGIIDFSTELCLLLTGFVFRTVGQCLLVSS